MDNGTTWTNFKNPTGTYHVTASGTYDITDYEYVEVPSIYKFSTSTTTYPSYTYNNSTSNDVDVTLDVIMDYSNVYSDAYMTISVNGTEVKRVGLNTRVTDTYTVPAGKSLNISGNLYNPYSHSGVQQHINGILYAYEV